MIVPGTETTSCVDCGRAIDTYPPEDGHWTWRCGRCGKTPTAMPVRPLLVDDRRAECSRAAGVFKGTVEGWSSPETRGAGCIIEIRLDDDIAESCPVGASVTVIADDGPG